METPPPLGYPGPVRWSSAVSDEPILEDAVASVARDVLAGMGGEPIDLAVLFVSHHFAKRYAEVAALVREAAPHGTLVGCTAGGVIGGGREVEQRSGLSLTAASLPSVAITPLALEASFLPDADAGPGAWHEAIGVAPEPTPHFVILADPFSFPAEDLLAGLDFAYPRSAKIGGLASGARQPGGNALYLGAPGAAAAAGVEVGATSATAARVLRSGAVGVALSGNVAVDTVVAQGCRPIGRPMRVTRCEGNVLIELEGEPPLKTIREIVISLPDEDRRIASHALFLGVVTNELLPEPGPGDFLIRNLVGLDPEHGAIAIGDHLRNGQIVQFHLRDPRAAAVDLGSVLDRFAGGSPAPEARGALLFSCLGRGVHLFGRPDHDTDIFRSRVGDIPLGGFFCNGEIGPVGGTTYLHGYTSAFGIFRPVR